MGGKSVKIGVAIAVHNGVERTMECLRALLNSRTSGELFAVVVDDGSEDGTAERLAGEFGSRITIVAADGSLWWAGGTNLAIDTCIKAGCEYVLLLNPDVVVANDTVEKLLEVAHCNPSTIVASLVIDYSNPQRILWAGSRWQPLVPWMRLIWVSRYCYRAGDSVDRLPLEPYESSEAHGRAVLVPISVFDKVGLYDEKHLPHYGADVDFSLRCGRHGVRIMIAPRIRVRLHVGSSGLSAGAVKGRTIAQFRRYLTSQKHGDALRVWWHVIRHQLPLYEAVPTYLAIIALNTYRFWIPRHVAKRK